MSGHRVHGVRIALLLGGLVVLAAVLPGIAAAEERAGGSIVVGANQTVDGDLNAAGGRVLIRGTVTGDLTVASGSLVIEGTVEGDVTGATGLAIIEGTVGGNVRLAAGHVVIGGPIGGNAEIGARNLTFREGGRIDGSLRYDAETVDGLDEGTVGGEVERQESPRGLYPLGSLGPGASVLYFALVHLVLGAILLGALPRVTNATTDRIRSRPVLAVVSGLVAIIAIPIILVLVAVTIVGLPIALLGLILFLAALWVGGIYGSIATGQGLLARLDHPHRWGGLVLGIGLVSLIGVVPILGPLVQLIVVLLGLGALTIGLLTSWRRVGWG